MAKEIVIVGGGVIGLCGAYYLLRRGHRVTVLERGPADHGGCSFGNAGMIVPSHFVPLAAPGMVKLGLKWMWNPESPFYIKPRLNRDLLSWGWKFNRAATPEHVAKSGPVLRDLHMGSRACFEELSGLPGNDFGLAKKGLLMLCKTKHALDDEAKMGEQARALGVPAEVLSPAQTAALDPNISMDIAGSVYFPKDCHLSPSLFMAGLKRQLDQLGAKFSWGTEVTGWRIRDRVIDAVETSKGAFKADEYLLSGGSWSAELARDLRLNIPMQAGKGYSLTLTKPPQLPSICSILCEARVAVTPMGTSLRIGGTMEIAGLDETINPVRVRGIVKSVPAYYPKFTADQFEGIQPWSGLRPCSPDGLPYLGRTRSYANLCVATGHSMMGLSLGPITGKLVSEILTDGAPSIPLELLSPDRYA